MKDPLILSSRVDGGARPRARGWWSPKVQAERGRKAVGSSAFLPATFGIAWLALCAVQPALAQSVLAASGDVPVALGPADVVARDDQVAADNQLGVIALESLGAIPAHADVIGYGQGPGALRYLAFDTTVELPSGVVARPGDVVEWNGTSHSLAFTAASVSGFPSGVRTDAIARALDGRLLLSFDSDVSLPLGIAAADEDLVAWNGSSFNLVFDGSAAGLDRRLDVDGAQDLHDGSLLLSFDTGGLAPGPFGSTTTFQDEDVVRYAAGVFTLEIDASTLDSDWGAADLDAFEVVPEPSGRGALGAVLAVLALLGSRRRPAPVASRGLPTILAAFGCVAISAPIEARAGDGRAEINQTCAATTGCFSGDAPGFPVTIDGSAGNAYRLTSDLTVLDPNSSVIFLASRNIDLDLAGHAIRGPRACAPGAGPPPCSQVAGNGAGIDSGIEAGTTGSRFVNQTIQGGLITGMASDGIRVGSASIRDMRIEYNGGDGIDLYGSGTVEDCLIARNDGRGLSAASDPLFVPNILEARRNTVIGNALDGIDLVFGTLVDNRVASNSGAGVRSLFGVYSSGNHVAENGEDGIIVTNDSALVWAVENVVHGNGQDGFDLGVATGGSFLIQRNSIDANSDAGMRIPNRGAYRENHIASGPGGSTVSNPLAIDLGANLCNGVALCP